MEPVPAATITRWRRDGTSFRLQSPGTFGSWKKHAQERARLSRKALVGHEKDESLIQELGAREAEVALITKLQNGRPVKTTVDPGEFLQFLEATGGSFPSKESALAATGSPKATGSPRTSKEAPETHQHNA